MLEKEPIGDVWKLESPDEEIASEILNFEFIEPAMNGGKSFQGFLVDLFEESNWENIKKKLKVEGSAWYVWYMNGVHKFMSLYNFNKETNTEQNQKP